MLKETRTSCVILTRKWGRTDQINMKPLSSAVGHAQGIRLYKNVALENAVNYIPVWHGVLNHNVQTRYSGSSCGSFQEEHSTELPLLKEPKSPHSHWVA